MLTRLPIFDELIQPLPYTEATPERQTYPRGALVITVQAPDGKPLRFISTHFQHNVPEDRVEEAKVINTLFAKPADKLRAILACDLMRNRRKSRSRSSNKTGLTPSTPRA